MTADIKAKMSERSHLKVHITFKGKNYSACNVSAG